MNILDVLTLFVVLMAAIVSSVLAADELADNGWLGALQTMVAMFLWYSWFKLVRLTAKLAQLRSKLKNL